ncbi:MAG: chemotaxis response regulator protein-glutamate methylesterase [Ramlibacter sp.]
MIKVLVIDDSAVMRRFLAAVVASQPDMELMGVASDPVVATERVRRTPPDVITLDVEMPRMNGLVFLRALMASRPTPVLMVSSHTQQGAETTLQALELGAVDFVAKPSSLEDMEAAGEVIAEKIRAAAQANIRRRPQAHSEAVTAGPLPSGRAPLIDAGSPATVARPQPRAIIGIGASTGGVEALRTVLGQLPAAMPPIVIAQHMLPGFTGPFAKRLDSLCALSVEEAKDGQRAQPGCIYLAPAGTHLVVRAQGNGYRLVLNDEPPVNRHRPSIDILFQSLAAAAGQNATGVLLTGMGADGARGLLAMRGQGALTIAQDEATSLVFGMPKQAIALGAAREVMGLPAVAGRLAALFAN